MKRCLNALEELGTLQVTSQILQKNTDVVATLKKVWQGQGIEGAGSMGLLWELGCLWSARRKPCSWEAPPGVVGDEGGCRDRGEAAAPSEPGLLVSQIRRYKANKEVMEKAAEVYTRLKSRVLGPKIEAIQKATKTGSEKERAEAEKAEEVLAGEEAPTERAEDEASTGEELKGGTRVAGRALSIGRCSPQTAWGHDPLALAVQTGCVHKVAGAWATHPCAAHRHCPQSQVV